MTASFPAFLVMIAISALALQFFLKMRMLRAARPASLNLLAADRYRPMLRLLSEDDLQIVASDTNLRAMVRSRRRELFRGYLRCLAKDYAALLHTLRQVVAQSGVDRPDLTGAIEKNRIFFAIAICRIEIRLALHAAGLGTVDISGLVEAIETLRSQVRVFSAVPVAA